MAATALAILCVVAVVMAVRSTGLWKRCSLANAASANDVDGVASAIRSGVHINTLVSVPFIEADFNVTPLMIAACHDNIETVRWLLEHGADTNAVEPRLQSTALHRVMWMPAADPLRRAATVRLLLEAGADPNIQDVRGNTPLHYATIARQSETARMLIAGGASQSIRNEDGHTPTDFAKQ